MIITVPLISLNIFRITNMSISVKTAVNGNIELRCLNLNQVSVKLVEWDSLHVLIQMALLLSMIFFSLVYHQKSFLRETFVLMMDFCFDKAFDVFCSSTDGSSDSSLFVCSLFWLTTEESLHVVVNSRQVLFSVIWKSSRSAALARITWKITAEQLNSKWKFSNISYDLCSLC